MADIRRAAGYLAVSVRVQAPVDAVWAAVTDWERQGQWMPATRVRATAQGGRGVGGGIEAFTGIGRIGFLDTMVITEWEPPHRCTVRHTGRLVRGGGVFEVADAPGGASTLTWIEDLDLPGGLLGRLGWRLIKPAVRYAVAHALAELSSSVAAATDAAL